ncbi:MAG: hypothetical protein RBR08_00385 [Desulforegulaceae bacterium]|nr:hypothetical protein [Desulforegulaceae bacterium]
MKKIFYTLIFIVISCKTFAGEFDFRTVNWGMTRVEVLASEKLRPLKVADDYISYKFKFFGGDIFLLYEFVLNNLLSAKYVYENPKDEHVEKIFEVLDIKYEKKETISNSVFYQNISTAVKIEYFDNYLKIYYKSKKIDELDKKNTEKLKENEKEYLLSIF